MGFKQLSSTQMAQVITELIGEQVTYQMDDQHAFYFDGANEEAEFKIVIDQDELKMEQRSVGSEDWYTTAYEDSLVETAMELDYL